MTEIISDSPDWFNPDVPDENRAAAIELDFENTFADNEDFQNADPATQQEYRLAHQQLIEEAALKSEHNPLNQKKIADQKSTDRAGFLQNLLGTVGRSLSNTADRVTMVDDLTGEVDGDYATQLANYYTKMDAAPITRERKQLAKDMKVWGERTEASGFWGDVAASAQLVGDIAANPGGILDVAGESLGSMAAMATGAKAGSLAAAGLTAATGGAAAPLAPFITGAGMFAAEVADAGSAKMAEKIREGLDERGIAYTPANIKMFLDNNPELIKQYQADSLKYGGVLGAVDVLMGGFFSKMATLPTRAARKEAMRSMDDASRAMLAEKAKELGVPVKDITEDFINRGAKDILNAQSFKKKLGGKVTSYAGEVASEPLSEAVATAGIGEDIKAEDLIYETLGGIGAGPIGASINTAAMGSKLAANKTGEFTKKILNSTPESRAEEATQKEEIQRQKDAAKQAKEQSDARANFNYKKDVADVKESTDARIDEWADPQNEKYDPIKAADALAKFTDVESIDKVRKVHNDLIPKREELDQRMQEIEAKITDGSVTQKEVDLYPQLQAEYQSLGVTKNRIFKQIELMRNKAADEAAKKEVAPLDTETAGDKEITDHITESFGSHGSKNAITSNIEQIDDLLKRADLSETNRALLTAMKESEQARKDVGDLALGSSKDLETVSNDIYRGMRGSEFKGIDAYKQAIAHYLNPQVNDTENAIKQLEGLKKFRDAHQLKSERITGIFEAMSAGKELSPKQKTDYAKMQRDNPKFFISASKSGRMVAAVQMEAAALSKEVATQEALFKARSANTRAVTRPDTQTSPESKPAPSVGKDEQLSNKNDRDIVRQYIVASLEDLKDPDILANVTDEDVAEAKAEVALLEKALADNDSAVIKKHADKERARKAPIKRDAALLVRNYRMLSEEVGYLKDRRDRARDKGDRVFADLTQKEIDGLTKELDHIKKELPSVETEVSKVKEQLNRARERNSLQVERDQISEINKEFLEQIKDKSLSELLTIERSKQKKAATLDPKGRLYATVVGEALAARYLIDRQQNQLKTADTITKDTQKIDTEETKSSTPEDNAGNVADKSEEAAEDLEYKDPGELDVEFTDTDGSLTTKPYNDAIADIDAEIEEINNILNCVKGI